MKNQKVYPVRLTASAVMVRLVTSAVMAALAVTLVLLVRIPFFVPTLSFLTYDIADVPILICSMMYGPLPGLAALLVVCVIQAFALGGHTLAGFLMHFVSSAALVVIVSMFHLLLNKWRWTITGMAVGIAAVCLIMIPMNLIVTVNLYNAPLKFVVSSMPMIMVFNLSKTVMVCIVTGILMKALAPFVEKNMYPVRFGKKKKTV